MKKQKKHKKHKYEIQGDLWHPTDTAWGSEADYSHRLRGETIEYWRDKVILRYLYAGDTRPLAALLGSPTQPDRSTRTVTPG